VKRLLLLIALLMAVPAQAATVRVGLFVGNNIGFGDDEPLRHAEREAADLAEIFQELGGLSRERTIVLQGATVEVVQDTITRLEGQIREIEARGDEVLLLFYYSGHANHNGLNLRGAQLPMEWLRRWLETSGARIRLAFVDACESGTLARIRGGTPVESVEISVDAGLTASGLAIITSTGPLSVARESEQFGGGVFSRALATGLRGVADRNGDGVVSLEEAYEYAFTETVIGTASSSSGVQRPEYRKELTGVGQVVLTRVAGGAAGLVFPEELEGVYTIVAVADGRIVARLEKKPGERRRVSLPTGRYLVRKVRKEDVLVAELDLVWGGDRWLDDAQMAVLPLGDPLTRGSPWSLRPILLSFRGTGSSPAADSNPGHGGGEIALRIRVKPTFGITFGGGYERGAKWAWTGRLQTGIARAMVGVMGERRFNKIDLQIGGGVQAMVIQQLFQTTTNGERNRLDGTEQRFTQFTAGPYVQAGVHIPVGPDVGLEFGARAVFYPVDVDFQRSFFAMAQAYAGVGFRFGGKKLGGATKAR
jgi:hypothetical protein